MLIGNVESVSNKDINHVGVQVYPNPGSAVLNVSDVQIPFDYRIIDVTGKLLTSGINHFGSIDISNLHSGMYWLKINKRRQSKFIKL